MIDHFKKSPIDDNSSKSKTKNSLNYLVDSKLDVKQNFDLTVDRAYIITIGGNDTSQQQTKKCIESCNAVGMPFQLFFGYDGTDKKTIKTPPHLNNADYMKWIKIMDSALCVTEVACALSHLAFMGALYNHKSTHCYIRARCCNDEKI